MKKSDINLFEKTQAQLSALHSEIGNLSKKSPNDAINKFKLNYINEVLKNANIILKGNYKPFGSFVLFEEEQLPTNSDVTLILSQYINCFEKLRSDNIVREKEYDGNKYFFEWYWLTEGYRSDIKTAPPKKIE